MKLTADIGALADNYGLSNVLLALANHCNDVSVSFDEDNLEGKNHHEDWQQAARTICLAAEDEHIVAMSDGAPCDLED